MPGNQGHTPQETWGQLMEVLFTREKQQGGQKTHKQQKGHVSHSSTQRGAIWGLLVILFGLSPGLHSLSLPPSLIEYSQIIFMSLRNKMVSLFYLLCLVLDFPPLDVLTSERFLNFLLYL